LRDRSLLLLPLPTSLLCWRVAIVVLKLLAHLHLSPQMASQSTAKSSGAFGEGLVQQQLIMLALQSGSRAQLRQARLRGQEENLLELMVDI
jgi:hypothetical protein